MTANNQQVLTSCIDTIESSYEYMLAYAAQGREKENAGGDGPGIRTYLENLDTAIGALPIALDALLAAESQVEVSAFLGVLERDSSTARKTVQLVLSLPQISSRIVDNLNASAHVRTLLTDMFLADEALKSLQTKP
ncbi:MAG TPA: hypothetical protein DCY55_08190 [Gammaproteobacteria bacterium]|nr:hypothetical protein [Gammaproteobacteria bacterium]